MNFIDLDTGCGIKVARIHDVTCFRMAIKDEVLPISTNLVIQLQALERQIELMIDGLYDFCSPFINSASYRQALDSTKDLDHMPFSVNGVMDFVTPTNSLSFVQITERQNDFSLKMTPPSGDDQYGARGVKILIECKEVIQIILSWINNAFSDLLPEELKYLAPMPANLKLNEASLN